ncbi:MAG: hybrid sensor histidine kinase/response regulator transcription factor, partial [Marinilabiliaceae bacterium]|nr:hybrid sensor histidine kinase/response regulator transcription factor [Marinilabiliaceae bacterium]
FPASRVFGLIEGVGGWYWVSSSNGLLKFRPETNSVLTFNTKSGLPFNQFNFNAYYRSKEGKMYFGGINGLVYFEDTGEKIINLLEDIVFTGLSVFNQRVIPGENSILAEDLRFSGNFKLKYSEKIFSVSYSALNFTHPGRVQYAYKLEGLRNEWISVGNQNTVTFTSLPPGKYRLWVRASFDNNTLNSKESSLLIVIKPPFYLSVLAYVVYAVIFLISLLIFYLVSRQIEKSKALAIIERSEKLQENRMNQSKLEFFTNVSHELKTPLTLIIGRLTNLVRQGALSSEHKKSLVSINDNARRLLALINQLMEFRKSDLGKTTLKVSEGDINLFTREIKEAFDYVAEMRNIDFRIHITTPFRAIWFDHEKLERILFNLLSNAFKYTGDSGNIIISVKAEQVNNSEAEKLRIDIEDNGSGIDAKDLDRIFDRFYRTENKEQVKPGSGIGLALVKNLVTLHKGNIDVVSKPGTGTVFSIVLPCSRAAFSDDELYCEELSYTMNTEELIHLEHNKEYHSDDPMLEPERETVLIVDDNTELLSFLSESISVKFNVITALDGNEAIDRISMHKPDIIISDVMMPGMDGYELTSKIKSSIETSHIPVILLSARTEVDDKYRGLLTGADAYIEKPFYPHLLLKHIENLLATRKKLISTFRENLKSKPSDIAQTKSDKEFIEKLSSLITANIDNPELDVTFLVNEISVSRSLLHLKLKKIAGCSATSFIRALRLRTAASLIIDEGISFSEAAYRTGFSSPAFFSRRFKEYFGKTPSQFLDSYKSGD